MTRSTSQIRALPEWNPPCADKPANVDAVVLAAFTALAAVFQRWAYLPRQRDTGGHVCRKITGGTGWSLHAYGPFLVFVFWNGTKVTLALALDTNWSTNPYGSRLVTDRPRGMVEEILALRTESGVQIFRWGGYYSGNKDAMHDEIVASYGELATGIVDPNVHTQPTRKKDMPSGPGSVFTSDGVEWQFALGLPDNGKRAIWLNHVDGNGWEQVPGGEWNSGPGAAVIDRPEGETVVVASRGTDGKAWLNFHTDGAWEGWFTIDGVITSAPSLAARADGTLVLSARGADGADWRRVRHPNGHWDDWVSLGGQLDAG